MSWLSILQYGAAAFEAVKAQDLIKENTFDIFILDFKMSGMDGVTLAKIIKEKQPQGAVVFISGRPFLEKILKEQNLLYAVDDVIPKPFDVPDLLGKIRQISSKIPPYK